MTPANKQRKELNYQNLKNKINQPIKSFCSEIGWSYHSFVQNLEKLQEKGILKLSWRFYRTIIWIKPQEEVKNE